MKNTKKKIKISSCKSLIKIKGKYLIVAIECLRDELKKEAPYEELIYCLCDYISIINKIISWFTILIKNQEGEVVEVQYAQAIVAKTYVTSFRILKKTLIQNYNTFVEIN